MLSGNKDFLYELDDEVYVILDVISAGLSSLFRGKYLLLSLKHCYKSLNDDTD